MEGLVVSSGRFDRKGPTVLGLGASPKRVPVRNAQHPSSILNGERPMGNLEDPSEKVVRYFLLRGFSDFEDKIRRRGIMRYHSDE